MMAMNPTGEKKIGKKLNPVNQVVINSFIFTLYLYLVISIL